MNRITILIAAAGCFAGCASTLPQTTHYQNGQVRYVDSREPGASVHGVGGVTSVTLDAHYVRFETAQGAYVIPREHLVGVASLPLVP